MKWPEKCPSCENEELVFCETVIDYDVTTSESELHCYKCGAIAYIVLNISLKSVEWKGGNKPPTPNKRSE